LNEKYLKHDNLLDLDGLDLFSELNILKEIIGLENDEPIDILNYIKQSKFFSKCIYRTMLTIPVASAERSFSKLKLIKSYLRSTMSQKKWKGLALLSIENIF